METNTQVLLGEHFENFVQEQINTGRYSSTNDVIITALHLFEQQEIKTKNLINELKLGENSKMIEYFDKKQILKNIHNKYLLNEV